MKIAELNQFIITPQPQVQFQTIICLSPAIFLTLFLIAIIYTCSPLNLFALERWPYQARKRMVLHLGPWRSHAWDQFLSQRRCLEVGMRRRITLAAKLQLVSYWKKAQTTTSAKVKSMLELVTLIPVWKCLWIIIPVHPILCCVFFRRSYKLSSIIQWLFYSWVIQPLRFLDSRYLLSKTCTKKTYGHKNDNLNTETKIRCVT